MREMASSFVLRSQAQAVYSPRNIGHFGLNLKRYAHFTSPIRRYSDLVVHRALIRQLGLGQDGLASRRRRGSAGEPGRAPVAHRAQGHGGRAARLRAAGGAVPGRPRRRGVRGTGDHRGLFRPVRHPGRDRRRRPGAGLEPGRRRLPCSTSATRPWSASAPARRFALGDRVKVELVEADPVQGTLLFRLESHEPGKGAELARAAWKKGGPRRATGRGRPPSRAPRRRS